MKNTKQKEVVKEEAAKKVSTQNFVDAIQKTNTELTASVDKYGRAKIKKGDQLVLQLRDTKAGISFCDNKWKTESKITTKKELEEKVKEMQDTLTES